MKHRPLLFLVLPLLLLAMMLASVRTFSGPGNTASAAAPALYLDLDGSDGWCTDIDDTDTVNVGEQHQAAICLVGQNPGNAPSDFDVVVQFNNSLNSCTNPYSVCGDAGTAKDGNPDFVALGANWNCSLGGLKCPYCDVNYSEDPPLTDLSEAFITCGTTTDPGTLSGPEALAVITWTVAAGGTVDNLTFGIASLSDFPGEVIVTCPSANCHGATVTKVGNTPQPTATSTRLPTATATPTCGGDGQEPCPTSTPTAKAKTRTPTPEATGTPAPGGPTSAPPPPPPPPPSGGQQPVVIPPVTGTGSDGIGWTGLLMWTLAGGAASLVIGGGLYLRRVTNR
jgi:hypothetical protein